MILFKRVGDSFRHIEDREWLLLVLETLGVLVGILLAFELQEWASNRAAAAKHDEMMDRLFEESEQDVGSLREIRDVLLAQSKAEVDFATQISAGKCTPKVPPLVPRQPPGGKRKMNGRTGRMAGWRQGERPRSIARWATPNGNPTFRRTLGLGHSPSGWFGPQA